MREALSLTAAQARRFLLEKHGLLGAYRFVGKRGALDFVRQAGCIQFDPVDACGRNAELTLFSRVRGFQKSQLYDLLYRNRALFDYADKELSILPIEDWPAFGHIRKLCQTSSRAFSGLAEAEAFALDYIRNNGPVSADTLPLDGQLFWHSSMHWSGNWHGQSSAARSVLEQLYSAGALVLHHKSGTRKFYDLAERHIPREILNAPYPFPDEQTRITWQVRRRIGAVGLLWNRRSDAFLGILGLANDARDAAFSALLAQNEILPVEVEGFREPMYALASDEPLLQAAGGSDRPRPRCSFLAPLDLLLWDRKLIQKLFGFAYTWEIYTPPAKRKYGYYVLPIVCGDRFIGRIEPVLDRKAGILTVKNIWPEPGIRLTKPLRAAIAREAQALARFNGAVCVLGAEL